MYNIRFKSDMPLSMQTKQRLAGCTIACKIKYYEGIKLLLMILS